jgi:putative transposase
MAIANFNREPPPGFQGLREDLPLTVYGRHLPHWRQDGATYFVTFRLADSLPKSKLCELEAIKREFASTHKVRRADCRSVQQDRRSPLPHGPNENWETYARSLAVKIETWLDEGMGACWLARPELAKVVVDALHYFDNDQYELDCYVVMPNHIHCLLRPLRPEDLPLEKVLQGRKLRMSLQINGILERSGQLWEEESFDRIVRDEEHLYRCIQYIGRNPAKARLPQDQWRRWIRPSWELLGWRFED